MEREYGCGAANIAQTHCRPAGLEALGPGDHSRNRAPAEVQSRTRCRRAKSAATRCFTGWSRRSCGAVSSRAWTPPIWNCWMPNISPMLFEKVVTEIAERGNCVIVGRGAAWFLRDRDDAFHAFLYAPYRRENAAAAGAGRESERKPNIFSNRWIASARRSSASTTARNGRTARFTT